MGDVGVAVHSDLDRILFAFDLHPFGQENVGVQNDCTRTFRFVGLDTVWWYFGGIGDDWKCGCYY